MLGIDISRKDAAADRTAHARCMLTGSGEMGPPSANLGLNGILLHIHSEFPRSPRIEADLLTLNPILLRDSLTECIAINEDNRIEYTQQRAFIHKVYNRRIKEFSAVYPFIFTAENALRSHLADHMESLTGRMDWWVIIRDAVIRGDDPSVFDDKTVKYGEQPRAIIRGVAVTPAFVKHVFKVISDQLGNSTMRHR